MTVTKTLNFDISNICHSCFLYIISKLFELGRTAKEVSMSDVKSVYLCGIEYHVKIWIKIKLSACIFKICLKKALNFCNVLKNKADFGILY